MKDRVYNFNEVLNKTLEYFDGDNLCTDVWMNKYALKDSQGNFYELSPKDMFERIANEIFRIEQKYKNSLSYDEILELISDFRYVIPQGGSLFGIGNDFQYTSLSNCFVIGNKEDSYGAILKTDEELVQLMKRRGGVGTDLSYIRPRNSEVKNSALTSTGIVPFMERFSNSTREVAQGGRRGALMLTLSVKHPDIIDFIDAKIDLTKVTGANISVKFTDEFLKCVEEDKMFELKYPIDSENPIIRKEIRARDLWDKFIENNWKSAEPGCLFWDKIIKESLTDCYSSLGYETFSTNPCSELPLPAYDTCRLISINLFSYVVNPFTTKAYFDFDLFKSHVIKAQRIMDDIIDLELEKIEKIINKIKSDPESDETKKCELNLWLKIKDVTTNFRRSGIGITGEADMLAALNYMYGSDDAIDFAVQVHKTLKHEAYRGSMILAQERGTFPLWNPDLEKNSVYLLRIKDENPQLYNELMKIGRRNVALLTIAPVGTISLLTRTSSGIEPVFQLYYKRRRKISPEEKNVKEVYIDKIGDKWTEYFVLHPKFKLWLDINNIKFDFNNDIEKLNDIIKISPYYNSCAHELDWKQRVKFQAKNNEHICSSISSTINLPSDVSIDCIKDIYMYAWKSGCKGITIYREGSRDGVLISKNKTFELENTVLPRGKVLKADVIRFQNNKEKWIAIVGKKDYNGIELPYEIFTGRLENFFIPNYVNTGEIIKRKENNESYYDLKYIDIDGYEVIMTGLSRKFNPEFWNYAKLISGLLRHRMPLPHIVNVVKKLDIGTDDINNWKNGIARVLSKYIKDGTKSKSTCIFCGSNLVYSEGCLKCESCGKYSKCS